MSNLAMMMMATDAGSWQGFGCQFFPDALDRSLQHLAMTSRSRSCLEVLGGDDDKWLVVFEEVLVGTNSAHFSYLLVAFSIRAIWRLHRWLTIWHEPAWVSAFVATRASLAEVDGDVRITGSWRSDDNDAW